MRGEWGVYKAQRISFCHVCIAIISRYSFQSSNQETREKVQTHSSGKMVHFRGTISIKSARERSPIRKQIMMPPRHACPVAGLVTSTQFPLVHRMLQGVEHTDPTEWSTSHLSQIVCYSGIFNFSFHFRRLRTYLYGIRTKTDYTYSDTYHTLTGCFLNS